jgi:hypothetical protein
VELRLAELAELLLAITAAVRLRAVELLRAVRAAVLLLAAAPAGLSNQVDSVLKFLSTKKERFYGLSF